VATIATNKLPPNLLVQDYTMAYMVVYLVNAYYIPPTFVMNNNPMESILCLMVVRKLGNQKEFNMCKC
jgi:hypothetical protein